MSYLQSNLVVCVPLTSYSVGDGVDHVNLKEVSWSRVRIVQSLLLTERVRGDIKYLSLIKDFVVQSTC